MAIYGGKLHIGIATGQRPDNDPPGSRDPEEVYSPGDIMIRTTAGVFGIEVGGGKGGTATLPVTLGDPGATYKLNTSGYTVDPYLLPTASDQTAGSVWSTAPSDWFKDQVGLPYTPTQLLGGTDAGDADAYLYNYAPSSSQHAVIELTVDLSVFGGGAVYGADWAPSCGNDLLHVRFEPSPEPGTLALAGFGLVGLVAYRHWRRRKRA
ncbi:MAG: PEP-CTERM sorting domain-containing protein [Planctomycetota bacterium]